jgi:hypothetical protein
MEFQYTLGATPLDPDEAAGLVPLHITTQVDLNAWEQANIAIGDQWAAWPSPQTISGVVAPSMLMLMPVT